MALFPRMDATNTTCIDLIIVIFSSSDKQIYPITEPDTSINVIVLKLKPVNRVHKICEIAQQKIRGNISYKNWRKPVPVERLRDLHAGEESPVLQRQECYR
jgi:hypothetical protein